MMDNILYIVLTVVLILVYPIIQYRIVSQKWKRIFFYIYIPCALVYIGVTIFLVTQSAKTESTLIALRDYSSVARLDALGNPPGAGIGSDLKVDTELTKLLEGTYTVARSRIFMKRDPEAEQRYRTVIERFPKFPFGYYFLAICLRERGDKKWRMHAEHAVEILHKTTQIDGHNSNHDEVFQKLLSWLNAKEET